MRETMPKLNEIPPEVDPKPNETVRLTFSTDSEIGVIAGEKGTSYAFPVVLSDGRKGVLKGGKRLLTAIQDAIGNAAGTFQLEVTPTGTKGTFSREWNAKKVG